MSTDAFYTPSHLAKRLLNLYPAGYEPTSIADLAAGQGALIEEAASRFPNATQQLNDIDDRSCKILSQKFPHARVDRIDIENEASKNQPSYFQALTSVDLMLANPPFSGRGGGGILATRYAGTIFRASRALAFVTSTLSAVSRTGMMLAILPAGCFTNERDQPLLNQISLDWKVDRFAVSGRTIFQGKSVNIILTRWTRREHRYIPHATYLASKPKHSQPSKNFVITRGHIPMYNRLKETIATELQPVVHTTDFFDFARSHKIPNRLISRNWIRNFVSGPALLIPRVGLPIRDRLPTVDADDHILLSDCVLAIRMDDPMNIDNLQQFFLENWPDFTSLFSGTGAKFTTKKRITGFVMAYLEAAQIGYRGHLDNVDTHNAY